jgi:hypothetical protein
VGDQEYGQAKCISQLADELIERRRADRIEAGRWLV